MGDPAFLLYIAISNDTAGLRVCSSSSPQPLALHAVSQVLFCPASLRRRESRGMPYWLASWLPDRLCTALHCTALHSAHAKAVQTLMTSQQMSGSIDPLLPPTYLRTLAATPSTPLPQLYPKLVCSVVV